MTMPTAHADTRIQDSGVTISVFDAPGEMAARCREFDWSATPLGRVDSWSHSLRTTAGIVLGSRNPMFLWWGPELVQLYNDAYRPSLGQGDRHPGALGARGRAFWTDVWDAIGPQVEQVMTTGEATWHEDQYLPIQRNGRLEDVWWTYGYSPVRDDDGRINGTLVVCQETTRRILAARDRERLLGELEVERVRLEEVFRRAPSFIAAFRGPEQVHEFVNDAYYEIIGRRDVLGKPFVEALPELRAQGFTDLLERVRITGEPWVGRETPALLQRIPGARAETRYLDMVFQPLTEADGTRSGVVAHGSDVTAQVLARREVERLLAESEKARSEAESARADAEGANRAKGEFLAIMSHELRTPLNAIGGYADLIDMELHGPVTEQQHADLARIQQSQKHLLGLINQVLNYTRVETGTVHYELADVSVTEALAAAEALVVPQVRAKGLTYVLGGCAPTVRVRADREKLQQILLNLLTNAIKFTDAGEIRVSCPAAGRTVSISVADTGRGIAADKLATVFEPFVQVDQRLTRSHEGVGLGLAISRDLARGMAGDLNVESTLGAGSTFTLTLPAVR